MHVSTANSSTASNRASANGSVSPSTTENSSPGCSFFAARSSRVSSRRRSHGENRAAQVRRTTVRDHIHSPEPLHRRRPPVATAHDPADAKTLWSRRPDPRIAIAMRPMKFCHRCDSQSGNRSVALILSPRLNRSNRSCHQHEIFPFVCSGFGNTR